MAYEWLMISMIQSGQPLVNQPSAVNHGPSLDEVGEATGQLLPRWGPKKAVISLEKCHITSMIFHDFP